MLVTISLALLNILINFLGTRIIRVPGFDITPIGIIAIARAGESVLLGAILLILGYCLVKPDRFAWIWMQIPLALLTGYLALVIMNPYVLILVYELGAVAIALPLGIFAQNPRHVPFILINTGVNFAAARLLPNA